MSHLIGAWLVGSGRASERLGGPARRAMLDVLCENPELSPTREIDRERLWLVAHRARLAVDGDDVIAAEGLIANGTDSLTDVLDDARQSRRWEPEGHYALVRADLAKGRLALVRSPSGGERLYFARIGELIVFSCSLRPLLAHPGLGRELDPDAARQLLLSGHVIRGSCSAIRGIHEVLPGHTAEIGDVIEQRWHCREALLPARGSRKQLASRFRDQLADGIARSIGPARPVAVALSGGIDSSAVAAALVDVVGASNVHALSYEFDDPTHPVETEYARSVVRRLGIRRHDVFRIGFAEFLDSIVEHVWRSESSVHWPKAFLLPVAKQIAKRGYDRYLTGFGIGSHMGYLSELARIVRWIPKRDVSLRYWSKVRFDGWDFFAHLSRLHPGLEPPHPRLFHLLLELCEAHGLIRDRRSFYPSELLPLLGAPRAPSEGDLVTSLQEEAFAHLVSCIDVTRSEKASRELGVLRISPAHFAGCLPYAYFPLDPPPPLFGAERRLRPGKLLLRDAYRGILPDDVLDRKKSWDDAVISRAWRKRGRVFMLRALPHHPGDLERLGSGVARAVEHYEPQSIQANGLAFRLFVELFVERPPSATAPSWADLWGVEPEVTRASRGATIRALPSRDRA